MGIEHNMHIQICTFSIFDYTTRWMQGGASGIVQMTGSIVQLVRGIVQSVGGTVQLAGGGHDRCDIASNN